MRLRARRRFAKSSPEAGLDGLRQRACEADVRRLVSCPVPCLHRTRADRGRRRLRAEARPGSRSLRILRCEAKDSRRPSPPSAAACTARWTGCGRRSEPRSIPGARKVYPARTSGTGLKTLTRSYGRGFTTRVTGVVEMRVTGSREEVTVRVRLNALPPFVPARSVPSLTASDCTFGFSRSCGLGRPHRSAVRALEYAAPAGSREDGAGRRVLGQSDHGRSDARHGRPRRAAVGARKEPGVRRRVDTAGLGGEDRMHGSRDAGLREVRAGVGAAVDAVVGPGPDGRRSVGVGGEAEDLPRREVCRAERPVGPIGRPVEALAGTREHRRAGPRLREQGSDDRRRKRRRKAVSRGDERQARIGRLEDAGGRRNVDEAGRPRVEQDVRRDADRPAASLPGLRAVRLVLDDASRGPRQPSAALLRVGGERRNRFGVRERESKARSSLPEIDAAFAQAGAPVGEECRGRRRSD